MKREAAVEKRGQDDIVNILDIKINNVTMQEALDKIERIIAEGVPRYQCGVNLNQIILVKENEMMRKIFGIAALLTADGKSVILMSKLLKRRIKEKISGPDLMVEACKMAAQKGYKVFFLGGAEGSAVNAIKNLRKIAPALMVSGYYSPPFGFEQDENEMNKIRKMLKESKSDMLFVGLGSPKQDIFIYENMQEYNIPISFSMGIAIDYMAGTVKRAPKWMQDFCLEWFYRFCREPRRLYRRYFIDSRRILRYYHDFKRKEKRGKYSEYENNFNRDDTQRII